MALAVLFVIELIHRLLAHFCALDLKCLRVAEAMLVLAFLFVKGALVEIGAAVQRIVLRPIGRGIAGSAMAIAGWIGFGFHLIRLSGQAAYIFAVAGLTAGATLAVSVASTAWSLLLRRAATVGAAADEGFRNVTVRMVILGLATLRVIAVPTFDALEETRHHRLGGADDLGTNRVAVLDALGHG